MTQERTSTIAAPQWATRTQPRPASPSDRRRSRRAVPASQRELVQLSLLAIPDPVE
jgi:hypothetical protein